MITTITRHLVAAVLDGTTFFTWRHKRSLTKTQVWVRPDTQIFNFWCSEEGITPTEAKEKSQCLTSKTTTILH